MKKLCLLLLILVLTSCEKYVTEISDLTISGRYVVYQVDVIYSDSQSQTFIGGQTYVGQLPHPFDNIQINNFYMLFDGAGFTGFYKLVRLQPFQSNLWLYGNNKDLFYQVSGNNGYNLGNLVLTYKPIGSEIFKTMIFKIEEDGYEHLKLLHSGIYNNQGNKTQIRLYLHREHP
jgi:hypothetical protein